ncbi:hypothetical protein P7C73_g2622, partial [Tremellales sp. Uapishka_1]
MSRLASLTPQRARTPRSSLSPSPGPPEAIETTHHRMLRLVILEVKNTIKTWDELVLIDGFKAGKGCVDESTEMDNLLQSPDVEERPALSTHFVALQEYREALEAVLGKLEKALVKLAMLVDQAEKIFFEACKLQSMDFALSEPFWSTWTLERFVDSLPPLLSLHNQHYAHLVVLSQSLLSPSTGFDTAKMVLEQWRDLSVGGQRFLGVREWEDLVGLELSGGEKDDDDEFANTGKVKRKGRK